MIIATAFTITIPAPVGRLKRIVSTMPMTKHITEHIPDVITRDLKLLAKFLAVTAGKIIRLEISRLPIILIPITIVRAVRNDIRKRYIETLIPDAFANDSSQVMIKMRL